MKFIAHPYDNHRLGDFLLEGLGSPAAAFTGASAFAQRSGVSYLSSAIRTFSETRPFQLTVGVDLTGTSVEALEMLLESRGAQARLFVLHNSAATFHPKIFRFDRGDRWEVYSGSGNLTRGGLFGNYEAGFVAGLDKNSDEDVQLNDRLDAEFERWSDTTSAVVRELTPALIRQLADCKLALRERTQSRVRAAARREAGTAAGNSPFGTLAVSPPPSAPTSGGPPPIATTTFVMTLQHADTRRPGSSPEIFIPKKARDVRPDFWGWPGRFVQQGTAMNRYNMPFRFRDRPEPSTMFAYTDRTEFRLRNLAMCSAARIGDIFRIRHDEARPDSVYEVDIIRAGTAEHARERMRCTIHATGSPRMYGYY
jgi:HKD family nuclease